MVVCVHLPRFQLVVAAGGPRALAGRPLAIAPPPGGEPRVGEASGAAEACGVVPGMTLGEALARCPQLTLVPADPLAVQRTWERALRALEGVGAAPESAEGHGGTAYFKADGLRGLYGGDGGTIAAVRGALGPRARIGGGPTRFCALAAALAVRSRRPAIVDEREARRYLASQPVALLRHRAQTAALVEPLARLGVRTLGELAALGGAAVVERFGEPGALARRLACGRDTPLRAREREDRLEESLQLAESNSGPALERVLGLLVDRLLAHPQRRGRTLRALTLSARLVESGTWRERVVLRQALSDPVRLRLALTARLALLPAPAEALALGVERFGAPEGEQRALLAYGRDARIERLRDGVAQVRAVAGPDGALRALCVDSQSRVPERRVVLTPFPL